MDGRRRAWATSGRLLMLGLAVVTGWGAVTAAGGTGHAMDVELAGPPSLTATAAPAALTADDTPAEDAEAGPADAARRTTRGSRSQDRLDPRFPGCDGVRAAGLGPYQARDAEYRWYPDVDGDGVVCD